VRGRDCALRAHRPGGDRHHRHPDRAHAAPAVSDWPPPDWERRFRAPRVQLPQWAEAAPDRAVLVASAHGVQQVHSWTPSTGRLVRATDRPSGTTEATIDPAGEWIWWFDDTAGDEYGRWRRQPFNSPAEANAETPILLAPDRKSTRLNSSHVSISYAVFCLKKKRRNQRRYVQGKAASELADSTDLHSNHDR